MVDSSVLRAEHTNASGGPVAGLRGAGIASMIYEIKDWIHYEGSITQRVAGSG